MLVHLCSCEGRGPSLLLRHEDRQGWRANARLAANHPVRARTSSSWIPACAGMLASAIIRSHRRRSFEFRFMPRFALRLGQRLPLPLQHRRMREDMIHPGSPDSAYI